MPATDRADSVLTIDLDALVENYRRLAARAAGAQVAAVVKADAYGLGAAEVAPALAAAGCRQFFVAHLSEGLALRPLLDQAEIFVLHGPSPGRERAFVDGRLTPVLSEPSQLEAWAALGRTAGGLDAILHIDTGLNRFGLGAADVDALAADPARLEGIRLRAVMSHLIAAEEPDNPLNPRQLARFEALRRKLPPAPASLAASSGIFLGPSYRFDLVRPGAALYGVNPTPGRPNPMAEAVRLQARIVQLREIDRPDTVGYGAAFQAAGPRRIATLPVGYADGYFRSLGNRAYGSIGGMRVPVVGRVSMDLLTLDVTDVPADRVAVGTMVDLIGGDISVDEVAERAGTIGYEVLTALGRRYARVYRHGQAGAR